MDKVNKFLTLFQDFDLVVVQKRKVTPNKPEVTASTAGYAGADLK